MEDTEMSIFSEQNEDQFIILPSQEETDQESQIEQQLTKMVKELPALQGAFPFPKEHELEEGAKMVDKDEMVKSDPPTVESISDSDDDDVTVVEKILSEERNEKEDDDKSQKAEWDNKKQCEVLDDVNGTRYEIPVSSSQDDMFKENECEENERTISTPAQHIGSLQLSQNPMLVPETIDDTLNEIPPTQGLFDSTPTIIPSSPTQDQGNLHELFDQPIITENSPLKNPELGLTKNDEEDNMSSFHLDSADTLCSHPQNERNQGREPADVVEDGGSGAETHVDPPVQQQSSVSQSFGNLVQPTLLDDVSPAHRKHKSNTSHCTTKQPDSNSLPSLDFIDVDQPGEGMDPHLQAPLSSQILKGCEVIVINSDNHLSQTEDSQDLALHLSLTGSEVSDVPKTQTQNSHMEPFQQSGVITVRSKNSARDKDGEVLSSETCEKTVIEIDCDVISASCSVNSPETIRSQSVAVEKIPESDPKLHNEEEGVDFQNNNDKSNQSKTDLDVDCDTDCGSHSIKPVEKTGSQSKSQEKSQRSGSNSKSHSEWKSAKKRAKMQRVNDHPWIEWKNESDTENPSDINVDSEVSSNRFSDEFHLLIPKTGAMSDTAIETNEIDSQIISTKPLCAEQVFIRNSNEGDSIKLPITSSSNGRHDELMLKMLEPDTVDSQSEFKLEKPQMEDSILLEDSEVIVPDFSSKKRRRARFILEDSDDEEVQLIEEKVEAVSQCLSGKSVASSEILLARKLDTAVETDSKTENSGDKVTMENNCDETDVIHPVVLNKAKRNARLFDSDEESNEKEKSACMSETAVQAHEEVFVAEKLDVAVESSEMTQTYDPLIPMETSIDGTKGKPMETSIDGTNEKSMETSIDGIKGKPNKTSIDGTNEKSMETSIDGIKGQPNKTSIVETNENPLETSIVGTNEKPLETSIDGTNEKPMETRIGGTNEKNVTEISRMTTRVRRRSKEQSTQTFEDKPGEELEGMALNAAQRVVEYLQTGCSPRSRSSSTCTDNSDSYKTPTSKKTEGTKSPKELQDVLKTYSDILNKKHRSRKKSGPDKSLLSPQTPNAASEDGDSTNKDGIRRRLSTQSLPAENTETKMNAFKRQFSFSAASNNNKTPGKQLYRHSVDNYYIGKCFDEVMTSKKNVPAEVDNKLETIPHTDGLVLEFHGNSKVKQHVSKAINCTVDGNSAITSHDKPHKKSTSDKEAVQRTQLKSKSSVTVDTGIKDLLTLNKTETQHKTPGKEKGSVPLNQCLSVVLPKIDINQLNNSKTKTLINSEPLKSKRRLGGTQSGGKCSTSRTVSGSFVSSTQTFSVSKETSLKKGHDPYQFHGSQSQITGVEVSPASPALPSVKRPKLQLQEIVSKKSNPVQECAADTARLNKQGDNVNMMSSQTSFVTATTIGSSPHIPSSSSQSHAEIENALSQTSSSSVHSDETNSRLPHKSQIKQTLPDALLNSPKGNNQMVTVVTETIEKVYTEITTVRKVIGPQGNIIESSQDVQRFDPVVVKENTSKKYFPSSSFDAEASLTPCDLPVVRRSPQSKPEMSSDEKSLPLAKSSECISDPRTASESPYQDQSVSSSFSLENQDTIVTSNGDIGSRVIAKWKDDFYYPGCLKSSVDRYSKYQVLFDDGDTMMVRGTDILRIERLPVGQSVMVLSDNEIFEFGLISGVQTDCYTIETDDAKSGTYTFSQVILSSDQAACILSDNGCNVTLQCQTSTGQPVNYGDVSLENLIDAPRRSAKKTSKEENDKQASHTDSGRSRKRKLDLLEPQCSSSPKPGNNSQSPVGKRRRVMDGLVHGLQASPLPVKKSTSKTRFGLSKNQLGPIPTKKIFNNMYFVLTNVEKSKELLDQEKQLLRDSSMDTSDESAVDEELGAPFDKDHIKCQVIAGGGTVLDNLSEKLVSSGGKRIVLLSSNYQRTFKYLQCLASGIPCISHMWIVDSCTQGTLLDEISYILPAGVSLEKRKVMEWKKKKAIFQGIKAVVYSKDKQFVECWSQILSLGKCTVRKQLQYTDLHVIVTDNSCTSTMERQSKSKGIPVVGTEWVIQSLINGRVVSYTGNLKYRHDTYLTKQDME